MTRTGKIARLARQAAAPYVELHVDDARLYALHDGDSVMVESLRGQVVVQVKVSARMRPGVVFMPFHWGDLFEQRVAANYLTHDALDPVSKEPEYKACAVRLTKAG